MQNIPFLQLTIHNVSFSSILCGHMMCRMRLKYFLKLRVRTLYIKCFSFYYFFFVLIPCGNLELVLTFVIKGVVSHTLVRTAKHNTAKNDTNIESF